MVHQLTKFHVQRVDMVINPPWNLPFLGAKGLTSPEQTAIGKGISNPFMAVMVCQKNHKVFNSPMFHVLRVEMVFSRPWTCTFLVAKGLATPELMANCTFKELQMLGFFLQMGFTLILATLDGLDVGLLGDVIGEDDCDEDE
ncbi:hypothetical protein Tco_0850379 [Tanacetum coccineum]